MSITPAQFTEMLARVQHNRLRDPKQPEPDAGREDSLHDKILTECRQRGWIVVHSRMDRPATVIVGCPDFIILRDGGRLLMVECKSRTGKRTTEQLGFAARAARLGHTVFTIRSFREFLQLVG